MMTATDYTEEAEDARLDNKGAIDGGHRKVKAANLIAKLNP